MADEYIKRDKIRSALYHEAFEKDSDMQKWDSGCWIRYKLFEIVLESIPSADVQPVVRCKDCKNLSFVDRFCYKNSIFVCSMDWFCAGGERRDGGT